MGALLGTSIILFLQFFSLVHGVVVKVPPLDITAKALPKYLRLENITIDVPALYVFGDATVDAGNSQYLNPDRFKGDTMIRFGEYLPGIPKGRVTNGRTVVDFIAQLAGLPFPPPVLAMSREQEKSTKTGVNYASQSSSINPVVFDDVAQRIGKSLCLDKQINLFEHTIRNLKKQFSSKEDYSQYVHKSLFFIHIGSDDFALAWDLHYKVNSTVNGYSRSIADMLSKGLQRLYQLGARKFVVNNVPPLGCQPFMIHSQKLTTACYEEANKLVSTYNKLLPGLLRELQSKLPESTFLLADVYKVFEDAIASPASYGFSNAKAACCSTQTTLFSSCIAQSEVCKDQNSYIYFDPSHPSEGMHFVWASRLLSDSSVCSPLSLVELMKA